MVPARAANAHRRFTGTAAALARAHAVRHELAALARRFLATTTAGTDHRYWFALAYVHATDSILHAVHTGRYERPDLMLRAVHEFHRIYRANLAQPGAHWKTALHPLDTPESTTLLSVYRAVRPQVIAHIQHDLPVVLARVYRRGTPLAALEADYRTTALQLGRAVRAFLRELQRHLRPAERRLLALLECCGLVSMPVTALVLADRRVARRKHLDTVHDRKLRARAPSGTRRDREDRSSGPQIRVYTARERARG